ncbi:MAG: hypothetical protein NPIRA01_26950 [Nitrospirales bacterium]|nr:MAG: hypothetical protein NPIRA01_26950 [Nitrospirales bacterium]
MDRFAVYSRFNYSETAERSVELTIIHNATTHIVQANVQRYGYNFRMFEVNNRAGLVDMPLLEFV